MIATVADKICHGRKSPELDFFGGSIVMGIARWMIYPIQMDEVVVPLGKLQKYCSMRFKNSVGICHCQVQLAVEPQDFLDFALKKVRQAAWLCLTLARWFLWQLGNGVFHGGWLPHIAPGWRMPGIFIAPVLRFIHFGELEQPDYRTGQLGNQDGLLHSIDSTCGNPKIVFDFLFLYI